MKTLSESLRDAMRASGLPLRDLAERAGVDVASVSRFLRAERSLALPTAERLADALGLELVARGPLRLRARPARGERKAGGT